MKYILSMIILWKKNLTVSNCPETGAHPETNHHKHIIINANLDAKKLMNLDLDFGKTPRGGTIECLFICILRLFSAQYNGILGC